MLSAFSPLALHLAAVTCSSLRQSADPSVFRIDAKPSWWLRFNAHGKWINPMRDAHVAQKLADDASLLTQGVRALDFTGGGLKDAPVRKLGEHLLQQPTRPHMRYSARMDTQMNNCEAEI